MENELPNIINKIDANIKTIINPFEFALMREIDNHIFSSGKKIRGVICYLFGKMLGRDEKIVLDIASICEIIHTATLLHDDVLDNSHLRRNKSSTNSIWGNKVSILAGDYLIALAIRKLLSLNSDKINTLFSDTVIKLVKGELLHHFYINNFSLDLDTYFEIIECKTASLFISACEAIQYVGEYVYEDGFLKSLGRDIGILFQIRDDLIDYIKENSDIGKPQFNDLINHTLTYPMLILKKNTTSEDKIILERILGNESFNESDKKIILDLMIKYKIKDCVVSTLKNYQNSIMNRLTSVNDSQYKKMFINILLELVEI
jgi:octaprenyl-diphosphate synthase